MEWHTRLHMSAVPTIKQPTSPSRTPWLNSTLYYITTITIVINKLSFFKSLLQVIVIIKIRYVYTVHTHARSMVWSAHTQWGWALQFGGMLSHLYYVYILFWLALGGATKYVYIYICIDKCTYSEEVEKDSTCQGT